MRSSTSSARATRDGDLQDAEAEGAGGGLHLRHNLEFEMPIMNYGLHWDWRHGMRGLGPHGSPKDAIVVTRRCFLAIPNSTLA